jgi:hypothetical protein
MKIGRIATGIIASLVLTVAVGAWALWYTEGGSRLVVNVLGQWAPGLTIDAVSGSLDSGLTAEHVTWRSAVVDVDAGRVFARLDPVALMHGEIRLTTADINALHVTVRPGAGQSDSPPKTVNIAVPIVIDTVAIYDATLAVGDDVNLSFVDVEGGLTLWHGALTVDEVSVRTDEARLSGDAVVQLNAPYRYTGDFAIQHALPEQYDFTVLSVSGHYDGDTSQAVITGKARIPDEIDIDAKIDIADGSRINLTAAAPLVELRRYGVQTITNALVAFEGRLSGYEMKGTAALHTSSDQALDMEFRGSGDRDSIALQQLALTGPDLALNADGRFDLDPVRLVANLQGVILGEAVTGTSTFEGESLTALVGEAHINQGANDLRIVAIPGGLRLHAQIDNPASLVRDAVGKVTLDGSTNFSDSVY